MAKTVNCVQDNVIRDPGTIRSHRRAFTEDGFHTGDIVEGLRRAISNHRPQRSLVLSSGKVPAKLETHSLNPYIDQICVFGDDRALSLPRGSPFDVFAELFRKEGIPFDETARCSADTEL